LYRSAGALMYPSLVLERLSVWGAHPFPERHSGSIAGFTTEWDCQRLASKSGCRWSTRNPREWERLAVNLLSERASWCLESRASEVRFLPLHPRPDTASKCESFPGRDEVPCKPCSRERDRRGGGLHDPTGCGLTLVPRNSARGGRKSRTASSSGSPFKIPTPTLTSFPGDRIEFCTCRPGAVRTHERFAPAVVRVGFQPAEVGLPLGTRRLGCWLDVQCDVATNPLAPVKVLTVLRESTSLSTARLGRAQNRQHEKAWRNEKIRNGKGLEEGEPTARLPWSCRPTLRILRLPSSPSAS